MTVKTEKLKIDKKIEKKIKAVEAVIKKEAVKKVKEVKAEKKTAEQERDHLQKLLNEVIENQTKSSVKDWINIFCWIVCFGLLIAEAVR